MSFMFFVCLSLITSISYGADTISSNDSISGDNTIISEGENFELGFFKAGNSLNYYIGIWYKKYPSKMRTIVWVANREAPVLDRFKSELKVVHGNLVLLNESMLPIWSTDVTTTASFNSAAVILNNGNLVLRDGSNSVEPVWQSFDHPSHTWMVGAKLAYNKKTNKSQPLTSWKSRDDPAIGLYSVEIHPFRTMAVSKWNGSLQYWDTGSWDPLMGNPFYNYSYHTNENESYFTYSSYNPSTVANFIVDVAGQLQLQTWSESTKDWNITWAQPEARCKVYALCGAFGTCRQSGLSLCSCLTGFQPKSESSWNQSDFSSGCLRKTNLDCGGNKGKTSFLMVKVTSLPPNSSIAVKSVGECRASCLKECSCNAYSIVDDKCSLWDGELLNLSEDNVNGKTIYVKVASKALLGQKKNNRVTMVAVVGSITVMAFVLGLGLLIIYRKRSMFGSKNFVTFVIFKFR